MLNIKPHEIFHCSNQEVESIEMFGHFMATTAQSRSHLQHAKPKVKLGCLSSS